MRPDVDGQPADDLPPGRRVAYWRRRRGMSQQVFADRLGRSKSWVDKIERGVRQLDKVSVLREIADALRVSVPQLVGAPIQAGGDAAGAGAAGPRLDVESVRAALTRHEVGLVPRPATLPDPEQLAASVTHAWSSLGRGDYPALLRGLPGLLHGAQWTRTVRRNGSSAGLLGQAYQITADVLTRVGEHQAAWLAADRAMATSADADDPLLAARAAGSLAAVVRESGRPRQAMEISIVTAHRLAGRDPLDGPPAYLSVFGTLLLEAAIAAAALADPASTGELLGQARAAARRVGPGRDHHHTGFGPALVGIADVAAQVELGHGTSAVDQVAELAADPDQQRLPAGVRAAHLLTVARAYLQVGDPIAAGRAVTQAEHTAPAEVRCRPAAREVLAAILRRTPRPEPAVARLAEALRVTV